MVEPIEFEPMTLERLGCIPTRSIGTRKNNELEIIPRDAGASGRHSHAGEAVKEPHFLDFRLCKINNLQVKNCQFWEFFYSLSTW